MHEAPWSRTDAEEVLDAPDRRRTQDPERLWKEVGLKEGEVVVDVGAGSGFFSFPAASAVGPLGHVFAVDVSRELVELVRERSEGRDLRNVEAVLSTSKRIPIEDAVADVVLLANVLHGLPPSTLDEAIRLLRPGGRLVNVDWRKKPTAEGPPVAHRLSEAEATRALSERGLRPRRSFGLGPTHYVLVFERPPLGRRPPRLLSAE